jgi:8-oxo-dGTP diphosphatase
VFDAGGRLLVVRRARPPAAGRWSIPGGRVESGESLAAAVEREVAEETGLRVRADHIVGRVEIPAGDGNVFDVTDFRATLLDNSADPVAGDDAAEAAWVDRRQLADLDCSPGLAAALEDWKVWGAH